MPHNTGWAQTNICNDGALSTSGDQLGNECQGLIVSGLRIGNVELWEEEKIVMNHFAELSNRGLDVSNYVYEKEMHTTSNRAGLCCGDNHTPQNPTVWKRIEYIQLTLGTDTLGSGEKRTGNCCDSTSGYGVPWSGEKTLYSRYPNEQTGISPYFGGSANPNVAQPYGDFFGSGAGPLGEPSYKGTHHFTKYQQMLNWLSGDGVTESKESKNSPLPIDYHHNIPSPYSPPYSGAGFVGYTYPVSPRTNNVELIDLTTTLAGGFNETFANIDKNIAPVNQGLSVPNRTIVLSQFTPPVLFLNSWKMRVDASTHAQYPLLGGTSNVNATVGIPQIGHQFKGVFYRIFESSSQNLGSFVSAPASSTILGIKTSVCNCPTAPPASPYNPTFFTGQWQCCEVLDDDANSATFNTVIDKCVELGGDGVDCGNSPKYIDEPTCKSSMVNGKCNPGDKISLDPTSGCTQIPYFLNPVQNEVCVTFEVELNTSLQVGDKLYYSIPEQTQSGINHPISPTHTKPILLGIITNVVYWDAGANQSLVCVADPLAATVSDINECDNVYYFFSKDNEANLTSLIGYYAEVEIRNNSLTEAEMFSITTDFSESSR